MQSLLTYSFGSRKFHLRLLTCFWVFILHVSQNNLCGQTYINYDAIGKMQLKNEKLINTPNLESSPAFIGDKIGYVYTGAKNKFFDNLIDEPYFDIGFTTVEMDNSLSDKKTFYKRINSDLHEGAMSFDINSNTLYFTRSHTERAIARKTDTTYLRIMMADLNLTNPIARPIAINVDYFSVCHPSLSQNGKTMIFSSNKIGGNGKMDLYTAYFDGAEWTGIVNLSASVNTTFNEIFPAMVNDSMLIFASDREQGFGGLDMYCSRLVNGEWSQPILLPKPINSAFYDFGMIVRNDLQSGYITSTRLGGKGKDDIYSWQTPMPIFGAADGVNMPVLVHVLDKLNLEPIADVKMKLTPLDIALNDFNLSSFNVDMLSGKPGEEMILKIKPKSSTKQVMFTGNSTGDVNVSVMPSKKYLIQLEKEGYRTASLVYDYDVFSKEFNMVMESAATVFESFDGINPEDTITVNPIVNESTGMSTIDIDPSGKYTFKNLYFEYNSHELKQVAQSDLDALSAYMLENISSNVVLESHTDSRGTAAYNMQLSIRRAESARNYVISKGISGDRINIRGYGETRLLNDCKDGKACKEIDHKENRRIECQLVD